MKNELDQIQILDASKLDSTLYFQSLIEEAHEKDLLSSSDMERLQYECLNLLAYKTERYNAGESSSVPVETAQGIMTSNLFAISVWLKACPTPEDAVTALQKEGIQSIYEKGRKRIGTILVTTKALHTRLVGQLAENKNVFYRGTLRDGILGFFKWYDPDYAAQEIHITADYPLYLPMPKLAGIEFIRSYVENAFWENQFCICFDPEDVHHLLCGYAEDYAELLMNLYEQVLTAALGCVLAGADISRLDITENGKEHLKHLFAQKTDANDILAELRKAADRLQEHFGFAQGLFQYLQNSLPFIVRKIKLAVSQNTLEQVFFTPVYPENKPRMTVSFGEKMEDGQYRKLIGEIRECRFSQDKILLIQRQVHSLADLEDVLLDGELNRGEIQGVLAGLSLPEFTALLKRYPLSAGMEAHGLRGQEHFLAECIDAFVSALSQEKQAQLVKAAGMIEAE